MISQTVDTIILFLFIIMEIFINHTDEKDTILTLQDYEEEILMRMYDEGLIGNNYKSQETVRSKIRWTELTQKYKIKKHFTVVMRRLESKQYVSSHGKSGAVYSLTEDGVLYVKGIA